MKAVVYTQYGPPDVLQLKEIDRPVPKDNEVLIKVHAATVNRTDAHMIRAQPFFMRAVTGLLKPKKNIPGSEFAGEIEETGKDAQSFTKGDRVFGFYDEGAGAQAQYMTITEDKVTTMPETISYEQAAASSEGAHYAINFINKVDMKSGMKVLVNGATGAIGSAAVQLLKSMYVYVTAVCSTKNMQLVRSLGADRVIDYTTEDFTKDAERYDYVFDTVGKSSFFKCRRLLKPGGVYISSDLGFMWQNIPLPLITRVIKPLIGYKRTAFPIPLDIQGSLAMIKKLMEEGKFNTVIDREYPLEQIVEAYKYVETGYKTGNVVITVAHDQEA